MNAVIKDKANQQATAVAESNLPNLQATEEDRQKRIALGKALSNQEERQKLIAERLKECKSSPPLSKEERKRRGERLLETMRRASDEARENGLTDEILEELLKDI